MNNLYAGFARADITPERGVGLSGYFFYRPNTGVLDNVEVNAVALQSGDKKVIIVTADLCYIQTSINDEMRKVIAEATGVDETAIFIHATHTHTAPLAQLTPNFDTGDEESFKVIGEYVAFLIKRVRDTALAAVEDLKPATMGVGVGKAENIAFIRRYRMKDGSVRTNPGVNNPDIVEPIGKLDESVNVIRLDREGANSIAIVNFADHPDTVGGSKVSGDWPSFTRRTVEKALDDVSCIFLNGAQGDVNHVNVHPTPGYLNDMFMDFDDVARGYKHAQYMGRVVAGAVLQVWDKVAYTDVDKINFAHKIVAIPSNMPSPEELPLAQKYADLHNAGKDDEIPIEGMMLTTVVAESMRMIRLKDGPEAFNMRLSSISIGNVAFIGIPGEPFNSIGREIKAKAEGWDLVVPCCLTNGEEGYFPSTDAYTEGGYEARSSSFKSGVAERIAEYSVELHDSIR